MDYIQTLISNVGFPIAMCIIMCYFYFKVIKSLEETVKTNTKAIETGLSMIADIKKKVDDDYE